MEFKNMKNPEDLDLSSPIQQMITQQLTSPEAWEGFVTNMARAQNYWVIGLLQDKPLSLWKRLVYELSKYAKTHNTPKAAFMLEDAWAIVKFLDGRAQRFIDAAQTDWMREEAESQGDGAVLDKSISLINKNQPQVKPEPPETPRDNHRW